MIAEEENCPGGMTPGVVERVKSARLSVPSPANNILASVGDFGAYSRLQAFAALAAGVVFHRQTRLRIGRIGCDLAFRPA